MASWVVSELIQADFGDTRLSDRLIKFVEAVADAPESGIPAACGSQGTKSAYRFLSNPKVQADKILASHAAAAVQRARQHDVVLAAQDTTTFSFPHHPSKKDLGTVNAQRHSRGMFLHSTLLLSAEGIPLGVLHQEMWSRRPEDFGQAKDRRKRPLAEKESRRWITSLEAVQRALPDQKRVVLIGDRESDLFGLFVAPRASHVHLLVRVACKTRRVEHPDKHLYAAVKNGPVRGQVELLLPRGDDRPSRTALLTIRWASLEVRPPSHYPRARRVAPVRLQFVLAEEENPPPGEKAVCWLLATTLPVENWEDALSCLNWYTYRWRIERLHFVLKSGCRIEQLQLETFERLQRAIACYLVVAWRLMWLLYQSRQTPDRSCEGILETHEWQALHARMRPREPLPDRPPSLREAVRMIAQLGGFLARKRDGEPGLKTLWRGLRRLEDLALGWRLARHHRSPPRKLARYG